jgi:hypothetical protein
VSKNILYIGITGWIILFVLLIAKYHDVMKFSALDSIYQQRELTGAVGSFWGYAQLYFTFFCSTLLMAYGLNNKKWLWYAVGCTGYFVMYLITAEKAQLLFPLFFIGINYLVAAEKNAFKLITNSIFVIAVLIFFVIYLSERFVIFDFAGFYLFTRIIATPSQFILDYYDFFSTNGYTYFSQIRGMSLLIDPPSIYGLHPKWPQLGWIIGSEFHDIESNSNATFLASDGAASLGVLGIFIVTLVLCVYLVIINHLSRKFPKSFWSVIFAQQAFILISGSFFSLLLSFGGLLYLLLFTQSGSKVLVNKNGL